MDFWNGIASITITRTDLQDLLAENTSNPIAEEAIPDLLKEAIKRGIKVTVTNVNGGDACQLLLDHGSFRLKR